MIQIKTEISILTSRRALVRWRAGCAALVLMIAGLLSGGGTAWAQAGPQQLPSIRLSAGMHVIKAEVAQTGQERAIGLMHRKTMGVGDGMLFVFEEPSQQCFWMRNTLIPLSIAFLSDDGTIVNIADMQPQTEDSHCSAKPVRFALEMNQGWFDKRGLKAGVRLMGSPFAAR